jgi:lipoprotein-anchoring transpeptidase ErfK/SrfK
MDQSLFALAVKGFGSGALLPSPTGRGHRRRERRFSNQGRERDPASRGRGLRNLANYGLSGVETVSLAGIVMRGVITGLLRVSALLSVVLAGTGSAAADDTDARNYFGTGVGSIFGGGGGSGPIARSTVNFNGNYAPGTIFIDTAERRLYLVLPNGQALRYGIGVGRDGFRWGGVHRISAKKEWPGWTPPAQMIARRPDLPRHMEGGIDNPLGARAMYLGSTLYRIHGSNEPETIGQAVSSGCFRMTNEDVTDLYNRVSVGATVVVKN